MHASTPRFVCCLQESRAAVEDVAVMSKSQLLRRKKVSKSCTLLQVSARNYNVLSPMKHHNYTMNPLHQNPPQCACKISLIAARLSFVIRLKHKQHPLTTTAAAAALYRPAAGLACRAVLGAEVAP